jgi:hypothetical protein
MPEDVTAGQRVVRWPAALFPGPRIRLDRPKSLFFLVCGRYLKVVILKWFFAFARN